MLGCLEDIGCWVFDLDGTLSNPAQGMLSSLNHALISQGFDKIPSNKINSFIGPPLESSLATLAGTTDAEVLRQLIASYRQHYKEQGFAENSLYDGIPRLLESLRQSGCTLGVCTAKTEPVARQILEHFAIADHFSFISGGDIGVRKGQQLERLLKSGEIDGQALMIGDRKFDLEAARENKLRSCGVLWGFGDHHELVGEKPDRLVSHPSELLELLSSTDSQSRSGNRQCG